MILPDFMIRDLIAQGVITGTREDAVVPYTPEEGEGALLAAQPIAVQPASLEVYIADCKPRIHCRGAGPFDPNKARPTEEVEWVREGEFEQAYLLPPLHMVLLATEERFKIPHDLVMDLRGCSTPARNGISAHICAGYVDPGFEGRIVLEVFNHDAYQHAILAVGERVGQMVFMQMAAPCERPYGSAGNRYQGQDGVVGARSRGGR